MSCGSGNGGGRDAASSCYPFFAFGSRDSKQSSSAAGGGPDYVNVRDLTGRDGPRNYPPNIVVDLTAGRGGQQAAARPTLRFLPGVRSPMETIPATAGGRQAVESPLPPPTPEVPNPGAPFRANCSMSLPTGAGGAYHNDRMSARSPPPPPGGLCSPVRQCTSGAVSPITPTAQPVPKLSVNTPPEDNVHGSLSSLGSNSSSAYSTSEELQAQEIRKLRQELAGAQTKIISLSNHLTTNAQVVYAFEQSLTNMTVRLQRLAANTNQKDAELNELRATIDSLRQQTSNRFSLGDGSICIQPESSQEHHLPLGRHISTDSIESGSSHHSSALSDRKNKKHKSWLSSFGKALPWRKKKDGAISDAESETLSLNADSSLSSIPAQLPLSSSVPSTPVKPLSPSPCIMLTALTAERRDGAVEILQRQLREKDLRLTDVQLEALTSAHQLHQMRDTMNRMKSEIASLRGDNERLHHLLTQKGVNLPSLGHSSQPPKSPSVQGISLGNPSSTLDFLLADEINSRSCQTIKLYVRLHSADVPSDTSEMLPLNKAAVNGELPVGELTVDTKTDWDSLHHMVCRNFKDHLLRLEPETGLGLSEESVKYFRVGEVTYGKDLPKPELLPCGYIVGDVHCISVTLYDADCQQVDSLAFEMLIPKPIIQRYVSLLVEHHRVILCGSSGTGKTYLARKLAEHLVIQSGKPLTATAVSVFNIDSQSSRELRQYLSSIAEQCEKKASELPAVIILDSLHRIATPLGDIFDGFVDVDLQTSPYIIGTMNQSTCSSTNLQLHHNFRWVLCANHMEPVNGFLGRYLRRQFITADLSASAPAAAGADIERIVEWIPRVWKHLNRILETHNSNEVTIGPRPFLSCPMDQKDVQVWFTDLWNYSLVPYMLEAVREGIQMYGIRAAWEDPTDWVISTCPWAESASCDLSGLLRIRPEDIGYESPASNADSHPKSPDVSETHDPLMNMLLRLQEAATYPPTGADIVTVE